MSDENAANYAVCIARFYSPSSYSMSPWVEGLTKSQADLYMKAPQLLNALRLVELDCEREDIPTDSDRVAYILRNVRAAITAALTIEGVK